MSNPHQVTRDFELAVSDYTGAPYCVAVNSCTMALLLAVAWFVKKRGWMRVSVPRRTYVGVPMSIKHAGAGVDFREEAWTGAYQLEPLPVWDSARWFTSGLYRDAVARSEGEELPLVCVSFHATKTLGIEQGGAILLSDAVADEWLRRMRFDGRTAGIPVKKDRIREVGWHCYMNPSTAAQGLMRMAGLPLHNDPLPNSDYPDLSLMEVFR